MRRAVISVLSIGLLVVVTGVTPSASRASVFTGGLSDARLFSVQRSVTLATTGANPSIAAVGGGSLYVVGTFDRSRGVVDDLIRVDSRSLRVEESTWLPSVTSVAYGDGSLWWATGALALNPGAPDGGRALLELDPTTLKARKTFILPGRTVLVAVAGRDLWIASRQGVDRVDPLTGREIAASLLSYAPVAMAASASGRQLLVVASRGSRQFLLSIDGVDGHVISRVELLGIDVAPPVELLNRLWLATAQTPTRTASIRSYSSTTLGPETVRSGYPSDEVVYGAAGVLWAADSGGLGRTECLDPRTGAVDATGAALGVGTGSVAGAGGDTFVLYQHGLVNELMKVKPTAACTRGGN